MTVYQKESDIKKMFSIIFYENRSVMYERIEGDSNEKMRRN